MAQTITVDSNFERVAGKTLATQGLLVSKIKEFPVTITYDATQNYVTSGNTVDLTVGGRIKTVIDVTSISNNKGLLLEYAPAAAEAAATGKLKCYGIDTGAAGGSIAGLVELTNDSQVTRNMVVKAHVRGF